MEKEGFGEEFSICSSDFFWRNSVGISLKNKIHYSFLSFLTNDKHIIT